MTCTHMISTHLHYYQGAKIQITSSCNLVNLTLNTFPLTLTTLLLTSFKATTLLPTNQLTLIDLDFTNSP